MKKAIMEYEKANVFIEEDMTFMQIAESYLEEHVKYNCSIGTYNKYSRQYNKYLKNTIGDLKLSQIKPWTINNTLIEARNYNPNKLLSNSTVKDIYAFINSCYNRSIKQGRIKYNPCIGADKIKVRDPIPRIFKTNEIESIFNILRPNFYDDFLMYSIIKLILETGIRRGELIALTYEDIDLENNRITISKQICYDEGKTYFNKYTKTNSSHRIIPISDNVRNIFIKIAQYNKYYRDICKHEYIENSFEGVCYNFIFRHQGGKYIHPLWAWGKLKNILERLNLNSSLTLHDLRHTFAATYLLESNGDISNLSYLLGHHSVAFTFKKYCHYIDSNRKITIDKISSKLYSNECYF